jgi:hypothetical protein
MQLFVIEVILNYALE